MKSNTSVGPDEAAPPAASGPSRALVLLLAVVVGAAVANIYYAQPLLSVIADDLNVAEGTSAFLVTASQIGYATALAFIVPIGDLYERRRLVTGLLVASAAGLALAAAAPTFAVLMVAVTLVGVTSSAAMVVVPLAASLADGRSRGKIVGTVMSGLLLGILLARTVSGSLSALGGWRLAYAVAAVLMAVTGIAVRLSVPHLPAPTTMSYRGVLRSVTHLVRTQPVLRQRMALAALGMGCFTMLWTAIAYLLAGPDYGCSPAVIGLFGLAGLAGAAAAPLGGRLIDRGHARRLLALALAGLLLSWGLLAIGKSSVAALIAGMVLIDFVLQILSINHQIAVFALAAEARSRLTTALTVSMFLGGAAASALVSWIYPAAGWYGVCTAGAVLAVIATLVWWVSEARIRRGSPMTPKEGLPA